LKPGWKRRARLAPATSLAAVIALLAMVAIGIAVTRDRPTAPAPKADATIARPALWRIADADTTIYLFGTIHALPANYRWRSETIDAAIDASDELVLEIADGEQVDEAALFGRMATDEPPDEPLIFRIDRDLVEAFGKTVAQTDLSRSQLDTMEDWAAAILIANAIGERAGLAQANGIEPALDARFRIAGKPVSALETTAQQFALFDGLPDAAQRAFLIRTIATAGDSDARMTALVDAWAGGRVDRLATLVADDVGAIPGLAPVLLTNRNRRWADILARRLDQPGTLFVAVGAAHLVGSQSVIEDLTAATGLTVERLQ